MTSVLKGTLLDWTSYSSRKFGYLAKYLKVCLTVTLTLQLELGIDLLSVAATQFIPFLAITRKSTVLHT